MEILILIFAAMVVVSWLFGSNKPPGRGGQRPRRGCRCHLR